MYKITVQDGAVTVTVECEEANEAAATLAVATLLRVQRERAARYYWQGPDRELAAAAYTAAAMQ